MSIFKCNCVSLLTNKYRKKNIPQTASQALEVNIGLDVNVNREALPRSTDNVEMTGHPGTTTVMGDVETSTVVDGAMVGGEYAEPHYQVLTNSSQTGANDSGDMVGGKNAEQPHYQALTNSSQKGANDSGDMVGGEHAETHYQALTNMSQRGANESPKASIF